MGFTARHPRYTMALIMLLFISVLIFANSEPSPRYLPRPYPLSFPKHGEGLPPGYVEDQIKTSEAYYQESLKERQKLITKWGPSPSQVAAFPSNGEFYTLCKQMCPVCCARFLPNCSFHAQGIFSHQHFNARTGCNVLAHLVTAVNGFVDWNVLRTRKIVLFIPSVR